MVKLKTALVLCVLCAWRAGAFLAPCWSIVEAVWVHGAVPKSIVSTENV